LLHEGRGRMSIRGSYLSVNEVRVYFNLERFGFIDEAIILIVDFWSSFQQRPVRRCFTTVIDHRGS
jgi:hypothetical protein